MEALKTTYQCFLSDRQATSLFDREKPAQRENNEQLSYLMQVNAAGGGHFDRNVLKSTVHRGGAGLLSETLLLYDQHRAVYIEHATELADYVDELLNERNLNKNPGRTHRERERGGSEEGRDTYQTQLREEGSHCTRLQVQKEDVWRQERREERRI
jgi:hypothetical protein